MMLITREGLFIRSQSCGSRGGRGTFWNFGRIIRVYTYVNWGRVGWLRGREMGTETEKGSLWVWEVTGPSSSVVLGLCTPYDAACVPSFSCP